ncbi:hypothetical protein L9F63_019522, partial [Diploptera punctata]
MSLEWRSWCRLCANSGGNGLHVFENQDLLLPEKIQKYLSISVNNQDELPHTVCHSCSQKLGSFDCYAEQCQRVQAMFRAMVEATIEMGDEIDTKVGLIREEFLQENGEEKSQGEEPVDTKKDIDMLAIEADSIFSSDCSGTLIKKSKNKVIKRRVLRSKSNLKTRGKKTGVITRAAAEGKIRGEVEGERRVSSRLQSLAQTQRDFEAATAGVSDSELVIKEEKDEEDADGTTKVEETPPPPPTVKKRGRPPKALVGAAKRKAKTPRIVKFGTNRDFYKRNCNYGSAMYVARYVETGILSPYIVDECMKKPLMSFVCVPNIALNIQTHTNTGVLN